MSATVPIRRLLIAQSCKIGHVACSKSPDAFGAVEYVKRVCEAHCGHAVAACNADHNSISKA